MSDIVVIGDALIDEVSAFGASTDNVGGAALNVAVGLERLGASAAVIAMIGHDRDGDTVRGYLRDRGVPVIATPAPLGTARATSTRANGEPTYAFNEAARNRRIDLVPDAISAIARAQIVVLSCLPFDDEATVAGIVTATASGVRVVIDPNPRAGMLNDVTLFRQNFLKLASTSLLIKVSDEDAELLGFASLDGLVQELLTSGARYVIATEGAGGATVASPAFSTRVPIARLDSPIVDTMGAGDATLASATSELLQKEPATEAEWRSILERAMEVAAATCRSVGAELQLPSA